MSETGGLFPFDDIEEFPIEDEETEDYIVRDFEIDWETMTLTGKVVEGVEAIAMWVQSALRTKRYRWAIYSWDFGEEYSELLGYSYSQEYLENEVERTITECITQHPYISGLENLEIQVTDSKIRITFTLITDFGEVEIDV